jgi:hypothetical protein
MSHPSMRVHLAVELMQWVATVLIGVERDRAHLLQVRRVDCLAGAVGHAEARRVDREARRRDLPSAGDVAAAPRRIGAGRAAAHGVVSPLRYIKQLRLTEARRLLLHDGLDFASTGLRVGYNDVS